MEDFKKLFRAFTGLRVAVAGDLMLDMYMWGQVDRISPEAPVPVVSLQRKESRIGGAGNVALNCRALGAEVTVWSVTGDDAEADELISLLEAGGIHTTGIFRSKDRVTTTKTRLISRNQQMMRLDQEITRDLSSADEKAFLTRAEKWIRKEKPHVLILEDYNKGLLTVEVITRLIAVCRENGVITAVDPKRKNFFSYTGTDIFKPNLKEVKEGLNILLEEVNEESLVTIHRELKKKLKHAISFITLSEKGVFYARDKKSGIIPSHLRHIADVSGAGDTVIAVAAMVYAASGNTHLMAEIANIAGGLVCEEVGTITISKDKLLHECELLLT